ncbi:glycosyltransferase [Mycobacterium camsae]|uniref:glycosyltransferase n=1 Tax=Mycobacterium gordonae TaxID=1778 RepID=UPI00197E4EC3|nr:glycosyltransferase [Mycobacterium gordonae]
MQVAIVCENDAWADSDDVVGGDLGDNTTQFCAALTRQGQTVTVYQRGSAVQASSVDSGGYRVVAAGVGPTAPVAPAKVLPFVTEWAAELERLWSSNSPEIVHAFGWLGGLAAQLAARRLLLPTVQSFHGLAATIGPAAEPGAVAERARLEPLLARNASWITGGSSPELETLSRLRRGRAQVSLLPAGIDCGRYLTPDPTTAGSLRIVQLERNPLPQSGFDRVIRSLPRLPDAELVLAQTQSETIRHRKEWAKLSRLADQLGVGKRVRFMGHVVAQDVPALLHSASVIACTARQMPSAATALAAMASGVVVVGVAVDALTDAVINGVTGTLVSPTNPHELTAALKLLQASRFQRDSMGSAGRSRVMSRFSWDRIALDASLTYGKVAVQKPKLAATPT